MSLTGLWALAWNLHYSHDAPVSGAWQCRSIPHEEHKCDEPAQGDPFDRLYEENRVGGRAMNRFVIAEPKLCIGCNTCMAACSMEHKAVGLQSAPRLTVTRTTEGTAPIMCRHCEDAPCARVCPVKAITHEDGAVVLNETVCVGCKLCAIACPFGAITPHGTSTAGVAGTHPNAPTQPSTLSPLLRWEMGVRSVAVKCDLCDFREDGPACIKICPTKAIFMVDPEALDESNAAKRAASALNLGENLSFINPTEHD